MSTDTVVTPPHAESAAAGISQETHNRVNSELEEARRQIALLKAKTDIIDNQKRQSLEGMQQSVASCIQDEIMSDPAFEPFKQEMAALPAWAGELTKSDALDTNLAFGRLISCASAKFKRQREEASALPEKSQLLADALKELEAIKSENGELKRQKGELTELVDQRTQAAQAFQDMLAKHQLITEQINFSQKTARENVDEKSDAATTAGLLTTITSKASAGASSSSLATPPAHRARRAAIHCASPSRHVTVASTTRPPWSGTRTRTRALPPAARGGGAGAAASAPAGAAAP